MEDERQPTSPIAVKATSLLAVVMGTADARPAAVARRRGTA